MKPKLQLLLPAVAFLSSAGCVLPRLEAGASWSDSWSAPAPMAEPDRYSGVDVAFTPTLWGPALGLHHCSDGDESFTAPYVTYNLGQTWGIPILKPLIGRYNWSQSHEETGLLAGLKVGARIPIADLDVTYLFLTFEYGWLKAYDVVGDHDARFQTATAGLFFVLFFGGVPGGGP